MVKRARRKVMALQTPSDKPLILIRIRFGRRAFWKLFYWLGFVYDVGAGIYMAVCGSWYWVSAMCLMAAMCFASATRPDPPKKGEKP